MNVEGIKPHEAMSAHLVVAKDYVEAIDRQVPYPVGALYMGHFALTGRVLEVFSNRDYIDILKSSLMIYGRNRTQAIGTAEKIDSIKGYRKCNGLVYIDGRLDDYAPGIRRRSKGVDLDFSKFIPGINDHAHVVPAELYPSLED